MAKSNSTSSNVSTDSTQSENVLNQATLGDVADSINRSIRALNEGFIIGRDGNPVMLPDNSGAKNVSTVSFVSPTSGIVLYGEKSEFRNEANQALMIYQINGNATGVGSPTKPFGVVDLGLFIDTPQNRDAVRAAVQSTFTADQVASPEWLARNAYFANSAHALRAKGSGGSGQSARSAAEAEIVKLKQGEKTVKAGVITGMLQTMLSTAKRLSK